MHQFSAAVATLRVGEVAHAEPSTLEVAFILRLQGGAARTAVAPREEVTVIRMSADRPLVNVSIERPHAHVRSPWRALICSASSRVSCSPSADAVTSRSTIT